MNRKADVVVIGCGAVGAAIAYFAAKAGLRVVALDATHPLAGTSGATFAWTGAHNKAPLHYHRFSLAAVEAHARLLAEEGIESQFHRLGSLNLFFGEKETAEARRRVEQKIGEGYHLRWLEGREARAMEPAVAPDLGGASWCAEDGHIYPFDLVKNCLARARAMGASVMRQSPVIGIRRGGGRVSGVEIPSGEIAAADVVCAAGIWSPAIGKLAGVEVPIHPSHGEILVTETLKPLLNHILSGAKQVPAGNVILGTVKWDGVEHRDVTTRGVQQIARGAVRVIPALHGVRLVRAFGAVRPMPPDDLPILGRTSLDGFWIAVMHSGITNAALVGKIMAGLLLGKDPPVDIAPYRWSRFGR
jgi:sarcosine oxidase subunit beta